MIYDFASNNYLPILNQKFRTSHYEASPLFYFTAHRLPHLSLSGNSPERNDEKAGLRAGVYLHGRTAAHTSVSLHLGDRGIFVPRPIDD